MKRPGAPSFTTPGAHPRWKSVRKHGGKWRCPFPYPSSQNIDRGNGTKGPIYFRKEISKNSSAWHPGMSPRPYRRCRYLKCGAQPVEGQSTPENLGRLPYHSQGRNGHHILYDRHDWGCQSRHRLQGYPQDVCASGTDPTEPSTLNQSDWGHQKSALLARVPTGRMCLGD